MGELFAVVMVQMGFQRVLELSCQPLFFFLVVFVDALYSFLNFVTEIAQRVLRCFTDFFSGYKIHAQMC
jgi:hypothetical protein